MQAPAPHVDVRSAQTLRQTMVDCQIRTFDVTDQKLIARFLAVPREAFVPESVRALAYSDVGLRIGTEAGAPERYLLPPFVLARLIQGARVTPRDRVLDVACALGYSSAILSGLAADVVALEVPALRARLASHLADAGFGAVRVEQGGLAEGVASSGPFDVILVNGAVETATDGLAAQLAEGGRLLAIVRDRLDPTGRAAKAMCLQKRNGEMGMRYLFDASAPVLPAFAEPAGFRF